MNTTITPPPQVLQLVQEEIERLFQEYQVKKKVLDRERQCIIDDFAKKIDAHKIQLLKNQLKNKK